MVNLMILPPLCSPEQMEREAVGLAYVRTAFPFLLDPNKWSCSRCFIHSLDTISQSSQVQRIQSQDAKLVNTKEEQLGSIKHRWDALSSWICPSNPAAVHEGKSMLLQHQATEGTSRRWCSSSPHKDIQDLKALNSRKHQPGKGAKLFSRVCSKISSPSYIPEAFQSLDQKAIILSQAWSCRWRPAVKLRQLQRSRHQDMWRPE